MNRVLQVIIWTAIVLLGLISYSVVALERGEPINSIHLLIAALCTYTIGYRFYSKWITTRVLLVDDRRATPCEVHDDGKDFVRTNKWIVFGHHFAAISGPGPLVGPVLAAQFGYLPSALWILIGVVLGGAVQDMVILFSSVRRDGKSLGQMVKEELNTAAGYIAILGILSILVILLAVLALVVVNALAESPWGVFTVGATIPIAMFMGGYLRYWRIGQVREASVIGGGLLLLAVWGGKFVYLDKEGLSQLFGLGAEPLAWCVLIYALAASVLPVWLLLAPRDYLSTFMKLGTIFILAVGVFLVLPDMKMPAVTRFIDGSGLVVPGSVFPFCFITIACGAISGFHSLIASGTTPKLITRESYVRPVGYGAMCLESLVAIMALIAACTLDPGVYLSMNFKGLGADAAAIAADTVARANAVGFPVTIEQMESIAGQIGEKTLFGRTGGAATLAVGMAQIFSRAVGDRWLDLWYHFAIMFEALFILTTLDAGTRVGRYLLQDALGNLWKPLADTRNFSSNLAASILMVAAWGYFLIQGVRDPEGGVRALWPLFGIANQLLASIALCLATTVILKTQLRLKASNTGNDRGRPILALVTIVPLIWLLSVTMTAGYQKVFHEEPDPNRPRIGFLQAARELDVQLPALQASLMDASASGDRVAAAQVEQLIRANRIQALNNKVDAVVAGLFMILVFLIVLLSVREWVLLAAQKRLAELHETSPVWLPDHAVVEKKPFRFFSLIALALALTREWSGEASTERCELSNSVREELERGRSPAAASCQPLPAVRRQRKQESYLHSTERRYRGITRCC